MKFSVRAEHAKHPLTKRLFHLMEEKRSNLAVAADVRQSEALLELADRVGPHVCVFKTHIDIVEDFQPEVTNQLQRLAKQHNFILFEDRKFADIGNTVQQQYEAGIYRISDWSSITNAHILPGPGIIEGLRKVGLPKGNGLLLLAQLSSQGSMTDAAYAYRALQYAFKYPDFVMGFICQEKIAEDPGFIHMTPGVQLGSPGDSLGQQYKTPAAAMEKGTDIVIVGRGIVEAQDPVLAACEYREASWLAYENTLLTLF